MYSDATWLVFHWTVEAEQTEVLLPHEVGDDIHGQGEDDGGVLLCCDGAESLQVAKLQGWRGLCDHEGRLLQSARGIHFTLCCDHLHAEQEGEIRIAGKKKPITPENSDLFSRNKLFNTCVCTPCACTVWIVLYVLTLALASRVASASAAMALCSWCGSFTSLISTRSTLMPQLSVASSRLVWKRQKEEEFTPVAYFDYSVPPTDEIHT